LGREKTAMATAVTSATWRNSACCRRRNNHHCTHGYVNIMSFNAFNFGCMWFGVRAQNLLRWMAVENRCGLGVRRVDKKYSQSHIWTDDGRTLGRGQKQECQSVKVKRNLVWPTDGRGIQSARVSAQKTGVKEGSCCERYFK
jgi:hypothetical protein